MRKIFDTTAVVVRSDDAPGGGGIVVLEGTDADGNPTQVIWTPDFDLATWYKSNYSEGNPPQFYTADTNASYTHTYVCFATGTLIDTSAGPAPVEKLQVGDCVLTLNAGPQPVIWAGRRTCLGYDKAARCGLIRVSSAMQAHFICRKTIACFCAPPTLI